MISSNKVLLVCQFPFNPLEMSVGNLSLLCLCVPSVSLCPFCVFVSLLCLCVPVSLRPRCFFLVSFQFFLLLLNPVFFLLLLNPVFFFSFSILFFSSPYQSCFFLLLLNPVFLLLLLNPVFFFSFSILFFLLLLNPVFYSPS